MSEEERIAAQVLLESIFRLAQPDETLEYWQQKFENAVRAIGFPVITATSKPNRKGKIALVGRFSFGELRTAAYPAEVKVAYDWAEEYRQKNIVEAQP